MKTILLSILFLVSSQFTFAGGTAFKHRIKSIEVIGNDEFKMVVERLSQDHTDAPYKPRTQVIHLRFSPQSFKSGVPSRLTKEKYIKSVNKLISELKANKDSYFGIMGQGLIPIESDINEWQSNGLEILDQADGKKVVYSYAKSI